MIVWLTGLPCSGKTTLARALAEALDCPAAAMECGRTVELLDGDDLRGSDFAAHVGFSPEDRANYLRQVGYLAQRLERAGAAYVVCSFVSPSEAVRASLPIDVLVYVECPAEVCERRDVKGLWARARAGGIRSFTGLDAPYEPPTSPTVTVHTDKQSISECLSLVLRVLV